MRAWLMDAYRSRNKVVLWLKRGEEDIRKEYDFSVSVYIAARKQASDFLSYNGIQHALCEKKDYHGRWKKVFAVKVPSIGSFESFVRWLERGMKHRVPLFNADIQPEQLFLYERRLTPFHAVDVESLTEIEEHMGPLKVMRLNVISSGDCRVHPDKPIARIIVDDVILEGEESEMLNAFSKLFSGKDPDVIVMDYAFARMPYLSSRLEFHGIKCALHRWDAAPIRYKGGKSFYTYGSVRYKDFAVRLNGRFLVDAASMVGTECDTDSVMELCSLSGGRFQQIASRSFGAVFQGMLVREMVRRRLLVPYKEKPVDRPISMLEMVKADRVGHTLDPKMGWHKDVCELDFASLYPWLIYNHNISTETILSDEEPFEHAPGLSVRISMAKKGIIPAAVKPLLDRRMMYKKNPTSVNKAKAVGLKWVLVTSYGYLRFREFKLGIASSHMAIGAFARELMLSSVKLAEEKGFLVVHGIIDSLYLEKKDVRDEEAKAFCDELEMITGIPVSFNGIYRWVVFLSSVNDELRPVPARYFGVFRSGEIKARGIEVRQRSSPIVVRKFQQRILELMAGKDSKEDIAALLPEACRMLRDTVEALPECDASELSMGVRLSKESYDRNIPQKYVIDSLKAKGVKVMPGHFVKYVYVEGKVVLPEDYSGRPDKDKYSELLMRSLFVVMQPFGATREKIRELCSIVRQARIEDYVVVRKICIPVAKNYEEKHGLSERLIRRRLEKDGWTVWRGGIIGIEDSEEVYPNVKKKYSMLTELLERHFPGKREHLSYLCDVHHGLPDFLAYRAGKFKFVECKLGHEQLLAGQKKCIVKLKELGFDVEVQSISERPRTVESSLNLVTGENYVHEKQKALKMKW